MSGYTKSVLRGAGLVLLVAQIAACTTPQQIAEKRDAAFISAGFHKGEYSQAQEAALLNTLDPFEVNQKPTDKGNVYLYADLDGCHCVWEGNEKAYQKYRPVGEEIDKLVNPAAPPPP